jgi:hypothetical protein
MKRVMRLSQQKSEAQVKLRDAEVFVKRVLTEHFGQKASAKTVRQVAKRVVATMPAPSAPNPKNRPHA